MGFQSTYPHGVRPWNRLTKRLHGMFQSTHPHGVRHESLPECDDSAGFNPRTRMGCDKDLNSFCVRYEVSIHAPAWGATSGLPLHISFDQFQSTHPHGVRRRTQRQAGRSVTVSIHAPAWGATSADQACLLLTVFQSTHPHGVRPPSSR